MELDDRSIPSSSSVEGTMHPLKRMVLSFGDLTPIFGPIKMAIEAARGKTVDGFELNRFEQACYGTAVACNLWSFYIVYDLLARRDFVDTGIAATICNTGYWASMLFGKARHTGNVLSLGTLADKAYVEVKDLTWRLISEE